MLRSPEKARWGGVCEFGAFSDKSGWDLCVEAFQEMEKSVDQGFDPGKVERCLVPERPANQEMSPSGRVNWWPGWGIVSAIAAAITPPSGSVTGGFAVVSLHSVSYVFLFAGLTTGRSSTSSGLPLRGRLGRRRHSQRTWRG